MLTLGAAVGLLCSCTSVFFQPDSKTYLTAAQTQLQLEEITIDDGDGPALSAWWIPAQLTAAYATAPPAGEPTKGTVLYLHGNAQNVSAHIASVHWLPKAGYNLLALDYRGYGQSAGAANVNGAIADIERALRWLNQRGKLQPENKVVLYGQSLGGALALLAAERSAFRQQIDGLITDSAFASFRGIAREKLSDVPVIGWFKWPLSWLITGQHRPLDAIAKLAPTPLLILHGSADITVPPQHAEALYQAASQPKTLWLGDGERHITMAHKPYWRQRLLEWLAALAPQPHAAD